MTSITYLASFTGSKWSLNKIAKSVLTLIFRAFDIGSGLSENTTIDDPSLSVRRTNKVNFLIAKLWRTIFGQWNNAEMVTVSALSSPRFSMSQWTLLRKRNKYPRSLAVVFFYALNLPALIRENAIRVIRNLNTSEFKG